MICFNLKKFVYWLYWVFISACRLFSSCSKWGLLTACGFSHCRAQALGTQASVVVGHWLSYSTTCGNLPDQGLNPCPLRWQVDS